MKKGIAGFLGAIVGAAAGIAAVNTLNDKQIEQKTQKIDKYRGYYNMLTQWLTIKQEGKSLEQWFVDGGYKEIAIYGVGEMGNRLYDELKNSDNVEIKYAIDKNAADTYLELKLLDMDGELPKVDLVVVTATFAFDEIEEELSKIIDYPIVSLDDVVYES